MFKLLSLSFIALLVSCQSIAPSGSSVNGQLKPFVDRDELAGAVYLVADKNGVVAVDSIGFADREKKIPMQRNTMFWIASQTKAMTAVALMVLVDEGKLSLNDPVEKYLPEFKKQMVISKKTKTQTILTKPARPFTVRETLNHMSGLPFRTGVEYPTLDGINLETKIRSYATTPLNTEPGTKYTYSNAGISTAARVLEVVSGMKYEDFMDERLLKPLGMNDTTMWPSEKQVKNIAKTYAPNKAKDKLEAIEIEYLIYPLSDKSKRHPMPGGGYFSTADDVALFCRMLLNGGELNGKRYLSKKSLLELSRKQTPEHIKNNYSLGFAVGDGWFGHGGACSTNMTVDTKNGLALIWMVQHRGFLGKGGGAQSLFKKWAAKKFK